MTGGDIAVVLGTRPEIIKLAPVANAIGGRARVVWSGQHYDPLLTEVIFSGADLPRPAEFLEGVGGSSRLEQIAAVMAGLSARFSTDRPSAVVVQGDTNTTNAAAQTAHYLGIPVIHVEAGLRSFDRAMPEEINRLVVGAVADLHCCATPGNAQHLRGAGVPESAIRITGNTIVEAVQAALPDRVRQQELLRARGLEPNSYILVTVHRPENTDDPNRLASILRTLAEQPWPVAFPAHPRTRAAIDKFGLRPDADRLTMMDPVDHPTFLGLAAQARLLVSDSGGVQEEVTVLKKPLVVVRNSTERPESIDAGFARLAVPSQLMAAIDAMLEPEVSRRLLTLPSPFGDGRAGVRIAREVIRLVDGRVGDGSRRPEAQPEAQKDAGPLEMSGGPVHSMPASR